MLTCITPNISIQTLLVFFLIREFHRASDSPTSPQTEPVAFKRNQAYLTQGILGRALGHAQDALELARSGGAISNSCTYCLHLLPVFFWDVGCQPNLGGNYIGIRHGRRKHPKTNMNPKIMGFFPWEISFPRYLWNQVDCWLVDFRWCYVMTSPPQLVGVLPGAWATSYS